VSNNNLEPIANYYPGDAVRFVERVYVGGVLVSMSFVFEVRSPDGSIVIPGTVIRDTDPSDGSGLIGCNYADILFPLTVPDGLWQAHWQRIDSAIDGNRNAFRRFRINPLPL
jgi:hypothetical protein